MEYSKPPDTSEESPRNEKEEQCVLCLLTNGTECKETFICVNCNENVCGTCLSKHITNKPTLTHTFISLENKATSDEDSESAKPFSYKDESVKTERESERIITPEDAVVDILSSEDFDCENEEQEQPLQRSLSLLSIASSVYSSGPYPDTLCTVCAVDEERMPKLVDAVLFCVECRANMCVKCIRKHNENKQRKFHTLKDMAGLTQPKPEDWEEDSAKQYLRYDCSFCEWGGEIRDAIRRCLDCEANYCFTCLRWHNRYEHNQNHVLYYLPGMGTGKGTEVCPIHPEETINKYCQDHDVVSCNLCMHHSHKQCENIEDVSIAAESIKDSDELAETKHMVNETKEAIMKLLQKRKEDMDRIKDDKSNIVYQLHINKERIINHIEDLESKIKENLDTKYKKFEDKINQDITKLEEVLSTLENQATQLQTVYHDNESQLFVNIKQAKMSKVETDTLIQDVDNAVDRETINFVLNTDIADTVCAKQSLGEFSFDTAKLHGEFSVKTETDTRTCYISGACLMPDGTIVVVDCYNMKLKQLDHTYKVQCEYRFTSPPIGVCMVSTHEVVVTLPNEYTVQFVTVDNKKLSQNRSFKVSAKCKGVAYSDGKLFVACGGSIKNADNHGSLDVYNMDGTLLQSYTTDRNNKHLFSLLHHVSISFDKKRIHVCDNRQGVITIDTQGQRQWMFRDPELIKPYHVCVVDRDTLLVSGHKSHNVFVIDRNGNKKAILLKQNDSIKYPRSLLYDKANMRLLVFNYQAKELGVYNLISA